MEMMFTLASMACRTACVTHSLLPIPLCPRTLRERIFDAGAMPLASPSRAAMIPLTCVPWPSVSCGSESLVKFL